MDKDLESVEIVFAQKLASGNPKIRLRALRRLRDHIEQESTQKDFDDENFIRLSKGLHYALWMQDKMILHEELAENICSLIYLFKSEDQSIEFARTLLTTLSKEWSLIDRWRMDKFLLLVRRIFRTMFCHMSNNKWNDQLIHKYTNFFKNTVISTSSSICESIKSHCASVYIDELDYTGNLPEEKTIEFLLPYAEVLATNISDFLFRSICEEVFDSILQQFSEELFEENYEEIAQDLSDEEKDKDVESESDQAENDNTHKNDQALDKPGIKFDYRKIAELLFDVGKQPTINAKRRKRIYGLSKKFEMAAKSLDPFPVAQIKPMKKNIPKEEITHAVDKLISLDVKQKKDKLKYKRTKKMAPEEERLANVTAVKKPPTSKTIKKRPKLPKKLKGKMKIASTHRNKFKRKLHKS